ncbi:DUF6716 putative glycosyltransferase [Demequina lignilytica]|uniref:Uncharacterized protein n=1 Tax=Demequina lignilytica TaxID=3051663 RepID=A0AB35MIG9_9MICO|nr:DUF6716 putative glycosyltransferase [Demequina sp. SYSU T0a273]MDN4483526.1 hypothetical protein [Demequina sp. SYSU T0a273]
MTRTPPPRLLVVADSDSYLKWAVSRVIEARRIWDVELVVVRNAVTPSAAQRHAAVDGRLPDPEVIRYSELVARLRSHRPDVLLLACRGPLIQLLLEETFLGEPPCDVALAGIPGIWMPPTALGLELRSAADLMIVHSARERRDVDAVLPLGNLRATGLASLIEADPLAGEERRRVVFAPQALVPRTVEQRRALLAGLITAARRHPDHDVVIKLRGEEGEAQTHAEFASFPQLAEEVSRTEWPRNLTFGHGPLREHLVGCAGFVTVSSTAALEAVAAGVPTLCLDDFGVSADVINAVFDGSGLFGTLEDLAELRFHTPDPGWMRDNYFHGHEADDWIDTTARLLSQARQGGRPAYRAPRRGVRGNLSRARRRFEALGAEDTAARRVLGIVARTGARAVRRALKRSRRAGSPDAITLSPSS